MNAPKYTYQALRAFLDEHGVPGDARHGEGLTAELPGIGQAVHDHPHSGRPHELHFMLDDVKIAELGPDSDAEGGDVSGGYVDFLSEWAHRPVNGPRVARIKERIAEDNMLTGDAPTARDRALLAYMDDHDGFNTGPHSAFRSGWDAAVAFMTR